MKRKVMGLLALLAAVIALGLAVIPGIALAPTNVEPEPAEQATGVTFRFKKFSVKLGGGKEDVRGNQADIEARNHREYLPKSFTISAVICSLIGLILNSLADRHGQLELTIPAACIRASKLPDQTRSQE
jgi:hypothetical protein